MSWFLQWISPLAHLPIKSPQPPLLTYNINFLHKLQKPLGIFNKVLYLNQTIAGAKNKQIEFLFFPVP